MLEVISTPFRTAVTRVTGSGTTRLTFAEDGPQKCSGLPVARYSAEALHHEFDGGFELIDSARELHVTPGGSTQSFQYCLCRFVPGASSRAA